MDPRILLGEWSASRPGRFIPEYPLDRRLGGFQNRYGPRGEKKIVLFSGLELRPLGRPACSQVLFRLPSGGGRGNGRERSCQNVKVTFWHYCLEELKTTTMNLHVWHLPFRFPPLSILLLLPIPLRLPYIRGKEHEAQTNDEAVIHFWEHLQSKWRCSCQGRGKPSHSMYSPGNMRLCFWQQTKEHKFALCSWHGPLGKWFARARVASANGHKNGSGRLTARGPRFCTLQDFLPPQTLPSVLLWKMNWRACRRVLQTEGFRLTM
jgi:hypothetical protein